MLLNPTIEGLRALRLPAMAQGLQEQREHPDLGGLSFDERLGLLVDREILARQSHRLERMLKNAKLMHGAVIEDLDFSGPRGLDKAAFKTIVGSDWVAHHHNVVIVGPTGVGKSFVACALAHQAVRDGYAALYLRVPRLLDDLRVARVDGRLSRLMASLSKVEVLILDDLLIRPLTTDQASDLLEIVEDRKTKSTITTSQLPVSLWHEGLGDATIADAILDRILERTHRIELQGVSRRRRDTTTKGDVKK